MYKNWGFFFFQNDEFFTLHYETNIDTSENKC